MKGKVIITLPVLLVGGTEMQTLLQVKVLAEAGYEVTVLCFYDEYDDAMCQVMADKGAKVELLGMQRSQGLLALLKRLFGLFRREQPDIVHVQYIAPGFIPVLAARLAGVPTTFATVHQPGRTYGRKAHLLLRSAARLCTAFFCNSLAVERTWFDGDAALFESQKTPQRRHWTIFNGVDCDGIAQVAAATDQARLRAELELGKRPVIGCVGRLRGEKGQAVLIEAMEQIVKDVPDTVLLLVGEGPDRSTLEARVHELGLFGHIQFLGRQAPEEVYRLLTIMDVVAVPSLFEGFGLAAVEAMAAGKAVVASRVDGLEDVVADGETGTLVAADDPAQLAEALVTLLTQPELCQGMGRKGRDRAQAMFTLERYKAAVLAAYAQFTERLQ